MQPDYGYFEEKKLGKPYDVKLLKRLYPFTRPYRMLLFGSIALVLLITVLDLALPYVTKVAIDRYIVPQIEQQHAVTKKSGDGSRSRVIQVDLSNPRHQALVNKHSALFEIEGETARIAYSALSQLDRSDLSILRYHDLTGIAVLTAVFVTLVLVNFILSFVQRMIMEYTGHMLMHDLRMKLFVHIQDLAIAFFTRNPVGRLVTRVTNDVQNMHELFTSVISMIFKDLFLLCGIAVVMLILNWKLALISFIVLPLVVYASLIFSRRARDIFRQLRIKVAEINTRFSETIGGIRVIQLFRQEISNYQKFKKLNHENYLAGMKQIHVLAIFMPLIEVLGVVAVALVIFYGGGVLNSTLSLGALVAFISYIRMFFRPIRDLAEKYNILQNAMASAERIFLIMDSQDSLPPPATQIRHSSANLQDIEHVEFEKVSFSYVAGETILKDITFSMQAGETVAVVGPTGAGKTSLINLLPRFYDPSSGQVRINHHDIRKLDPAWFRSKIALVMQDPFLFSGTIRDNIFQGDQVPGNDQQRSVIEASNCQSLIDRLPQGLDTMLSEGGASISSGERQLISIARAFARNPQLILFDEATSYIDSPTELRIQQALAKLMKNRTALVVAHRLSTVRNADRIIVLNRGRIIETGTHGGLMDQKGFYFKLHHFQRNFLAKRYFR